MKILEKVTRYRCSHCDKEYKQKSGCSMHEKRCGRNPENHTGCDGCLHFDIREKVINEGGYMEPPQVGRCFYCLKKKVGMYPPIITSKPLFKLRSDLFVGEIPMPAPGVCQDKETVDFW